MYLGILISIVFFVSTLVFLLKRSRVLKKYSYLNDICSKANLELDSLLVYYSSFDDSKKQEYINRYNTLTKECYQLKESIFVKSLYNDSAIKIFLSNIEEIDSIQKKHNYLFEEIYSTYAKIALMKNWWEQLQGFVGYTMCQCFLSEARIIYDKLKGYRKILGEKYNEVANRVSLFIPFEKAYKGFSNEQGRNAHNIKYMNSMLEKHGFIFDTMFSYPLDKQQRDAIVNLEDNVLVIASAGSGKTSTIVGKANYLIKVIGIDPKKILILTYTAKAAEELRERINVEGLVASTFHKHALDTIGIITGSKPTIPDSKLLSQIFLSIFENDKDFQSWFIKYETMYTNLMKDLFEYKSAAEYIADKEKYGKTCPYKDSKGKTPFCRSKQEIEIFVYLTELGLDVRYEEFYKYDTSDPRFGKYKPDFSIHYPVQYLKDDGSLETKEEILYLEHFGISKSMHYIRRNLHILQALISQLVKYISKLMVYYKDLIYLLTL